MIRCGGADLATRPSLINYYIRLERKNSVEMQISCGIGNDSRGGSGLLTIQILKGLERRIWRKYKYHMITVMIGVADLA